MEEQRRLDFEAPPTPIGDPERMRFDGDDYVPERDDVRLSGQILRVFDCMKDGQWRTLGLIANLTGDPEASVSAQLRHLRKDRFGGHQVEKKHVERGLYTYRLIVKEQ